jgi:hypothetical protein
MKLWELWLGRPRSLRIPLWVFAATVAVIGLSIVAERLGYWIYDWWTDTLMGCLEISILWIMVARAPYSMLAVAVLFSPLAYLWTTGFLGKVDVGFWFVTSLTTVAGAVLMMRALRVAKFYRDHGLQETKKE